MSMEIASKKASAKRVAVIFDNTRRPETTGIYCLRALEKLVKVRHFLPSQLADVSPGEFDLYLYVDDGLRYDIPKRLRPSAWWAIDTHLDFQWYRTRSLDFDFVFAAQRDGARRLSDEGTAETIWLPLACDPEIHNRHDMPKELDVCFVGNVFPGPRADLLNLIRQYHQNHFIGQRYGEEMAKTYSASRIVFNRSVGNDVNMRVFEALACGSLLLTNDLGDNGQDEFFLDGVHLATYREPEELLDKITYYLEREDIRERIAAAGRDEVLAKHTYRHRMETILHIVEVRRHPVEVAVSRRIDKRNLAAKAPSCPEQDSVSACLVAWKRHQNTKRIVQELQSIEVIDDIIVWNNNTNTSLTIDHPKVTVVNSDRNMMTYGRFLATRYAKHDVIYTQDDDCLVHNIRDLYRSFVKNAECITHSLKPPHMHRTEERIFGQAQMALVGWGAFFKKQFVGVVDRYIDVYGEDELLLREADRIFSILLSRPHRAVPAQVTDLPGHSGAEALSVDPEHPRKVSRAIQRAVALTKGKKDKDSTYFDGARPELLAMIPRSARRVLDIGWRWPSGRSRQSETTRKNCWHRTRGTSSRGGAHPPGRGVCW